MDEPFLLSNFIDLQEIDNESYKIEAQKGESDDVILLKELELQYKKANTELDESKNNLSEYFVQLEKDELDTKNIKQKIENIEVFHPDRIANRILGMGDIVSLVEKAADEIDEEKLGKKKYENSL